MKAADKQGYPDTRELQHEIALIELDADFGRLLNSKDVIIVGPAETLRGKGQGKIIDAHDLVVRFNSAIQYIPFPRKLANDIGTRTDILYCNNEVIIKQILFQQGISHEKFRRVCEVAGIKYLVSTNNGFTFTAPDEREPHCRSEYLAFNLLLKQQGLGMGFRMLHSTSARARTLLNGYTGRTGFLAILDLLSYDIHRLTITGMTFYHSGGHLFFKDSAGELHPMKDHLGRESPESVKGHNSYLELELMRKLSRLYKSKLHLDEPLQMLLDARGIAERPG
jgi:Glycosyltransferase family 29 (sialyltransferase)